MLYAMIKRLRVIDKLFLVIINCILDNVNCTLYVRKHSTSGPHYM